MVNFIPMPKIARLSRDIVITEKIDGTNASIWIGTDPSSGLVAVLTGSKNRWLTREQDNFGFDKWVTENITEILELGEGLHRGEWWGSGINRGYGLPKGEKRFSLFNTHRWADRHMGDITYLGSGAVGGTPGENQKWAPACCRVVPVLYKGPFTMKAVELALDSLKFNGSIVAPFMNPEGIVIYHTAGNMMFKKTIENDELPKGLVQK